ncbi:Carnitine O-palmitoyltransferase 1, liver isoform [Seminavis robusta]|uniref:Carnitine O-palmitoyltransferase 1, liver isoform n=1 Tax=Seminavis robusta TaxID=568900 RepID=A0A9N8EFG0_9STRA|nr:Carnitine O-palmitoyltransferase 1, liver isoform [Seminavis robusta]|eukprot:Sro1074_g238330.1 Carnitine O-palmitoyltransferase 1, liver isoform (724) ;mRNA; f:24529-26700
MSGRLATMSFLAPLRANPAFNHRQHHHRAFIVPAMASSSPKTQQSRRFSATASNFTVYESKGNYLADAQQLEDPSLPLYSAQDSIPRLPVPTLEDTCRRFLPTALPLANNNDQITASLKQAVEEFPAQASTLQQRLLQRAQDNASSSWLQEWWNALGYLQVRDPVVVHVSYFFRCDDDPTLDRLIVNQNKNTPASYQPCVARSAALLPVAIQYAKDMLSNHTQPATMGRRGQQVTLCSSQYKYMFQACRIPQKDSDTYRLYYSTKKNQPQQQQQHVIVACRGQFFAIPVNDDQQLTQRQWRQVLHHCIEHTNPTTKSNLPPSLGWFTGMNRDNWAEARKALLEQGGAPLQEAFTCLESGLFMICLDIDDEIRDDRDRALQFWHGRGDRTSLDYHNRWHDKSAAIIVTQNGKMGFQGEHSMLDGMPFVDFCDTMVARGTVDEDCLVAADEEHTNNNNGEPPCQVTNIFQHAFDTMPATARSQINSALLDARHEFLQNTDAYELHAQNYDGYGSNVMKRAKCSPDAYIQMAMQLASYRMFGEPLATYESTQVRRFLHGRTETARTVSPASVAFCEAMTPRDSPQNSELRAHRYKLLQEACNSHVQYVRNAVVGQGVDRHFFGLSMCLGDDEKQPDLFSHPLFAKSKSYRMSTSSLPNCAVGFGPVVSDGFGCGYEAKPTSCIFHVSALKKHGWTEPMVEHLGEALDDMRALFDLEEELPPPRNKL